MSMTLLEVVQEFCNRTGVDSPAAVMTSTDLAVKQIKALANEVITDITSRGNSWPKLQKEGSFTTVAAELQGAITTIAPYGFKYLCLDTVYDRTNRRPLFGPKSAPLWQEAKAIVVTGPFYAWRLWRGNLYMQPTPPAGYSIYFEYASDYAILDADGTTYKKRFAADTDTFALDENLLLLGLRWKWKAEKGLRFVTEKQDYEATLAQAMAEDGTKGELNMADNSPGEIRPGIFVPSGSWNIP